MHEHVCSSVNECACFCICVSLCECECMSVCLYVSVCVSECMRFQPGQRNDAEGNKE